MKPFCKILLLLFIYQITLTASAQKQALITMTSDGETGDPFFLHLIGASEKGTKVQIDYGDGKLVKAVIYNYKWVELSDKLRQSKVIKIYAKPDDIQGLQCANNRLTSLDVSRCTQLVQLACYDNRLKELNLSKNTHLYGLSCSDNLLEKIDVSAMPELIKLSCGNNALSELDVTNNTLLEKLTCDINEIEQIDISNNRELKVFTCANNEISYLDLSNNAEITELDFSFNPISSLIDPHQKATLAENKLKKLILTLATTEEEGERLNLSISPNRSNTKIYIDYGDGVERTTILAESNEWCNAAGVIKGDTLKIYGSADAIASIRCRNNRLTYVDLSNCTGLQVLDIPDNLFESLDVSNNTKLREIDCNNNQIKLLNLAHNPELSVLHCLNNPLPFLETYTSLDLKAPKQTKIRKMSERERFVEEMPKGMPKGLRIAQKSELQEYKWHLESIDGEPIISDETDKYHFEFEFFDESGNQKSHPSLDGLKNNMNELSILFVISFDSSISNGIIMSGEDEDNPIYRMKRLLDIESYHFFMNDKDQLIIRTEDGKQAVLSALQSEIEVVELRSR